jgi:hypothetical protein
MLSLERHTDLGRTAVQFRLIAVLPVILDAQHRSASRNAGEMLKTVAALAATASADPPAACSA